jgi:hypothetical protein
MNRRSIARGFALSMASLLAGCATNSLQYDHGVKVVNLPGAEAAGQALVLGQAYMRGYGDWVVVFITSVDQEKTFNPMGLRPNINLQMPAGKRALKVKAMFGSFARSQETGEPQLAVNLVDGQVYQLHAREATNIRGQAGVELWVEHIGTRAQYDQWRKSNPGHKGEPVQRGELTQ